LVESPKLHNTNNLDRDSYQKKNIYINGL